jgi:hypothetical protein
MIGQVLADVAGGRFHVAERRDPRQGRGRRSSVVALRPRRPDERPCHGTRSFPSARIRRMPRASVDVEVILRSRRLSRGSARGAHASPKAPAVVLLEEAFLGPALRAAHQADRALCRGRAASAARRQRSSPRARLWSDHSQGRSPDRGLLIATSLSAAAAEADPWNGRRFFRSLTSRSRLVTTQPDEACRAVRGSRRQ